MDRYYETNHIPYTYLIGWSKHKKNRRDTPHVSLAL